MPTSNQIPIEELNNILEANQEISPGMKNALDNLKEEYNQAYKSLMIYPDQEIPDEFVEELLGARKKLMDYNYLSDEERQYHQDILECVKKMIKRLTRTIPPKRGPNPQGLNVPLKQVKTANLENTNGRYRQNVTKRKNIYRG